MTRRSLRPHLNQIRGWVRQGRTDAWIAHQLEVSTSELREFRSQHGFTPDEEDGGSQEVDLRDEIEAEIEAELEQPAEPEQEEGTTDEGEEPKEDGGRRRRRRRRGGRGRGRKRKGLEATFDHGEKEGYGLWLDAAVKDDPVYSEHWAKQRALKVTIEPERIVLERADD